MAKSLLKRKKRKSLEQHTADVIKLAGVADYCPSTMQAVKTPLKKRIRRSKFNALLEEMSDEELRIVAGAILFSEKIQLAMAMYHGSVGNYTQAAALAEQMHKRGIFISSQG